MANNKEISNLFASIAAAQTMVEQFPFSFGMSESGFTCTFDLLTAIFNLISDEPLKEKFISEISDKLSDTNNTWLQNIEDTVKIALEANITNLITCEINPIIPDRLIVAGENLDLNINEYGITIPLSALDFTNMLQYCPTDENSSIATTNYFPCYNENGSSLGVVDLWKHDDFNAFLWYVKNKGIYNNPTEKGKLIWDNRYKTRPYTKYERKPESFFTQSGDGKTPFDKAYLERYNDNPSNRYKKHQILECRYIDADGTKSDAIQFRLAASNYYRTRNLTGKKSSNNILSINKTIFEFNHDFLMSLKLFDPKTYLCQMVNYMLGDGNISLNLSVTKNDVGIEELIDSIIEKVIHLSDTEINDCFYSFSNQEYDMMIQTALKRRELNQQNKEITQEIYNEISKMDFQKSSFQDNRNVIENSLTKLSKEVETGENTINKWKINYDYQFELIRMLVYPLIRPLFSPKVMALLLINLEVMGDPSKILDKKTLSFSDVLPYMMNIIHGVIVSIKDVINEMLYTWVIEKLTPILTLFNLRLVMEQIDLYKQLIQNMIVACTFNGAKKGLSTIGVVDYVDIDPEIEKTKQTPISKTNC